MKIDTSLIQSQSKFFITSVTKNTKIKKLSSWSLNIKEYSYSEF